MNQITNSSKIQEDKEEEKFLVLKKYAKQTRELIANLNSQNCHLCGKQFVSKYILHTHLKTLHNRNPHECKKCGFNTESLPELKHHIQQVHILNKKQLQSNGQTISTGIINYSQSIQDQYQSNQKRQIQSISQEISFKSVKKLKIEQDDYSNDMCSHSTAQEMPEQSVQWYVSGESDPKIDINQDFEEKLVKKENDQQMNNMFEIKTVLGSLISDQSNSEQHIGQQQQMIFYQQINNNQQLIQQEI